MGRQTFSQTAFRSSVNTNTRAGKSATDRGEEYVRKTGKLNPLVDPAESGVVRESRIRLEQRPDGLWEVTVGAPTPIEYRLDTTASMGDNVDKALAALPTICGLTGVVLPGRDPHYCAGIFGDYTDDFILCRGQFEMLADRMVNQLTLMNPEKGGAGNQGEDPQYGIFGAAYLTRAYFHRIGMKSFDFTVTDEPSHEPFKLHDLKRVFGPEVIEKANANGHEIKASRLPSVQEAAHALFARAHAFCFVVGNEASTRRYWLNLYGESRVIFLPAVEYLAHAMAAVIGLTEGTLDLRSTGDFLTSHEIRKPDASMLVDALSNIPLGAQRALPNYGKIPVKGNVFQGKDDLWPIPQDELAEFLKGSKKKPGKADPVTADTGGWL